MDLGIFSQESSLRRIERELAESGNHTVSPKFPLIFPAISPDLE
jgi:hypothetical protein